MPSFNLTSQPWIPVLMVDGSFRELSLVEVLEKAPQVRRITGNPLEVAVLHRLMFAIAQHVKTPKNQAEWLSLWKDKPQLLQRMSAYLHEVKDKFDLYSTHEPFGQHPGLENPTRTPAEIVYDRAQGNNPVFLDASQVSDPIQVPSSVAARAMLVTHAYGGSGTGALNPLNGNKKDTMYAGPLCARMVAIVEGENLEETILYNLLEAKQIGRPAWERPRTDKPTQTPTEGICDLYTRTTRNLRLAPSADGSRCIGVGAFMGEGVLAEDGGQDDPMIPTYLAKDKKFKALRLDPEKALWRNAHVLLAEEDTDDRRALAAINQLNAPVTDGLLQDRGAVRLRALGVSANAQGPVTDAWRDEVLPFRFSLFRKKTGYVGLKRAIDAAEDKAWLLRKRLRGFATAYLSNGGSAPDPKDVERLEIELSAAVTQFWTEIGPSGERLAESEIDHDKWGKTLQIAYTKAWRTAMNRLSPDARRMRAEFVQRKSA